MEQNTQNVIDQNAEVKTAWQQPSFRVIEAKDAELGLGVGADLIILGTSS